MTDEITSNDHRVRRCPMLGHDLAFSYCRAPARPLPCGKIFDCWWEAFDVEAFIRAHYDEADIERILAPRPDKVASIVDLIQRASRSAEGQ